MTFLFLRGKGQKTGRLCWGVRVEVLRVRLDLRLRLGMDLRGEEEEREGFVITCVS